MGNGVNGTWQSRSLPCSTSPVARRMLAMQQSLDVGGILSRVFDLYKKHLVTLLTIGAVIFIPLGIIEGVLRYDNGVILALVGSIVSLVGTYLFVGTVVRLVQDVQDGTL